MKKSTLIYPALLIILLSVSINIFAQVNVSQAEAKKAVELLDKLLGIEEEEESDTIVEKVKVIYDDTVRSVVIKYERKWQDERLFMLLLNITRILTLRHPLIGVRTFNMQEGAYAHSMDMAEIDSMSHDGFKKRGKKYNFSGENVVWIFYTHHYDRVGVAALEFYWLWLTSKGHRQNMLSRDYLFTGVGFCKRETLRYNIHGHVMWHYADVYGTQVFR